MPWYQTSVARFVNGASVVAGEVFYSAATLTDATLTVVAGPAAALVTTGTLASGLELATYADGTVLVIPPAVGSLAAGTPLDGGTVGGVALPTAFLSRTAVAAQTVAGPVTYTKPLSAQGGLDVSVTVDWSGGTNDNDDNPSQGGIGAVQRFFGTVAAVTQSYGGTMLNELLILDSLNAGLAGGAVGFNVAQIASSTQLLGARTGMQSTLTMVCPTGNTGGEYSGLEAYCIASGNDNGTSSAASGGIFGLNTVAQLGSTCTWWGSCVGYEVDLSVAAGANVQAVFGLHICTLNPHAVNGSQDDIALHISGSGGSAFWQNGIGFGANTKPTAFGPASTFIRAFPDIFSGSLTVLNGIDFVNGGVIHFTGNVLNLPDFVLPGQTNAAAIALGASGAHQVTLGGQTLATTAAIGFAQISGGAGAPTGAAPNGSLYLDSTNSKLWARIGGAWKGVAVS